MHTHQRQPTVASSMVRPRSGLRDNLSAALLVLQDAKGPLWLMAQQAA